MIKDRHCLKYLAEIVIAGLVFITCGVAPVRAGWGKITEIAFDESAPAEKWIEIYVVEDVNIDGAELYHSYNTSVPDNHDFEQVLVFPDLEVEEGDFLIVEFNVKHDQDHDTQSDPKVFYSEYPDSTQRRPFSSQGALYLTAPDGQTWIDAVIFARRGTDNFYMEKEYSSATYHNQWGPDNLDPQKYWDYVAMLEDDDSGWSLQRKRDHITGQPLDTNTKEDWFYARTSRGAGYFTEPPAIDDSDLMVYPNPFNTEAGQEVRIVLPDDFTGSPRELRIYTVDGVLVRDKDARTDNLSWDGTNNSGNMCASGLYFFYLEIDNGGNKEGKITLVR